MLRSQTGVPAHGFRQVVSIPIAGRSPPLPRGSKVANGDPGVSRLARSTCNRLDDAMLRQRAWRDFIEFEQFPRESCSLVPSPDSFEKSGSRSSSLSRVEKATLLSGWREEKENPDGPFRKLTLASVLIVGVYSPPTCPNSSSSSSLPLSLSLSLCTEY